MTDSLTFSPSQTGEPAQFGIEIRSRVPGNESIRLACIGPTDISVVCRDVFMPLIEAYLNTDKDYAAVTKKLFSTPLPKLGTKQECTTTHRETVEEPDETSTRTFKEVERRVSVPAIDVYNTVNVSIVSEEEFNSYFKDELYEIEFADRSRDDTDNDDEEEWGLRVTDGLWSAKIYPDDTREDIEQSLLSLKWNKKDFNRVDPTQNEQCHGREFCHPAKECMATANCDPHTYVKQLEASDMDPGGLKAEMLLLIQMISRDIQTGSRSSVGTSISSDGDVEPRSELVIDRPGQWKEQGVYSPETVEVNGDTDESIPTEMFLEFQAYTPCSTVDLSGSKKSGVSIIPNPESKCIEIDTRDLYLDTVPHDLSQNASVTSTVETYHNDKPTLDVYKTINTTIKVPFTGGIMKERISNASDTGCGQKIFSVLNSYEYLLEQREYNQCLHGAGLDDDMSLHTESVWSVKASFPLFTDLLAASIDDIESQTILSQNKAESLHSVMHERNWYRLGDEKPEEILVHERNVRRGRMGSTVDTRYTGS